MRQRQQRSNADPKALFNRIMALWKRFRAALQIRDRTRQGTLAPIGQAHNQKKRPT
jgi:hypothetical protein